MKQLIASILSFLPLAVLAKDIEMADQMRSEGKIYVVIAVVLAILFGLIIYLFRIDRKVAKLEEEVKNIES